MTKDRRDVGTSAGAGAGADGQSGERWREVVRLLEDNARARIRHEAIEAALLVEARDCEVATRLGYVSLEEFVERHLGYGRHAANERVRVAYELEALPQLRAAHEDGTLSFSHVRELTRVATPQTEGAYLAAAAGKTSRQVQQLVSGKRAGDAPEAPPDPNLVKHTVVLELGGEAFAMWRRAQQQLEADVGERLSTDELVMQLCTQAFAPAVIVRDDRGAAGGERDRSRGTAAVMREDAGAVPSPGGGGCEGAVPLPQSAEGGSDRSRGTAAVMTGDAAAVRSPGGAGGGGCEGAVPLSAERGSDRSRGTGAAMIAAHGTAPGSTGTMVDDRARRLSRAPRLAPPQTLHAVTTCRRCQRATASAVGSAEPLTEAQRDRALCDAIEIGDLETSDRTRPTLTVPRAIRRKVAIACNHACVVPGCRSRRYLTIHHLRYQAHGGVHTVENCALICHAHHARLHEGRLRIEGTAPHALDIAWRHPTTADEQDEGAGPWAWRRVPPDPAGRRGGR